jgi:hypothetical protein
VDDRPRSRPGWPTSAGPEIGLVSRGDGIAASRAGTLLTRAVEKIYVSVGQILWQRGKGRARGLPSVPPEEPQ